MAAEDKKSGGFRLELGEPLAGDLADFQKAHYNASATEIIRQALRDFIDVRLVEEPAMRKRYEAAKKDRTGAK